jgi:hypothetical protein
MFVPCSLNSYDFPFFLSSQVRQKFLF